MTLLQTQIKTNTWIPATWDEYLQILEQPNFTKAKGYYYNQKMRIEMSPVGSDHANDHTLIIAAISLFTAIKGIDLNGKDNCTYRQTGVLEIQPDVSYYIGKNADAVPIGTGIINLEIYPPPNLVIEVANHSLPDDKGEKRLIYEDLKVQEYWIIDVQNVQVIAFAIADQGSRRITESLVLPGLSILLLNEALQRSRRMNQGQVYQWLLNQFQAPN